MQATLQAHRVETTLQQDGTLTLDYLPFQAGESVEVIVLRRPAASVADTNPYPLRGVSVHYAEPFEPVAAVQEWDATR